MYTRGVSAGLCGSYHIQTYPWPIGWDVNGCLVYGECHYLCTRQTSGESAAPILAERNQPNFDEWLSITVGGLLQGNFFLSI